MAERVSTLEPSTAPEPVAADGRRLLAYLLGAIFVGLVVAVDPGGLVPTSPLRWFVTVAFVVFVAIAMVLQPVRVDRRTTVLWFGLLTWLTLAALFGLDGGYRWIGTPDRRLGLYAWVVFALVFFAAQQMRADRDRVLVLRGASLAAAALGVWCIFEWFDYSLIDVSFAHHRIGGSFGQPAYLGAAAVLLGPLSFALAATRAQARGWRAVGAFGVVAMTCALLASQTRAAWVGVLVATIVVVRGVARWIAIGVAVVVVALALTVGDRGDGTARGRVAEWNVATNVIAEYPLTGVGPEGYRIAFPESVDEGYVRHYGVEVQPDRAHNGILDVGAVGGVPAALAYGALLVLVVLRAVRLARRRDPTSLALAFALIAYVTQQMFLFPLSELDPLFWIVTGIVFAVPAQEPERQWTWKPSRSAPVLLGVVVVSLLVLVPSSFEIVSDRRLKAAVDAPGDSNLEAAARATELQPNSIRNWFVASRVAGRAEAITSLDAAIAYIESGLDVSPRDPALRAELARLLVDRAARSGLPDDLDRAVAAVDRFLTDAPNDPRLWLARGRAALAGEDRATARRALARAADLDPVDQVIRDLLAEAEKP